MQATTTDLDKSSQRRVTPERVSQAISAFAPTYILDAAVHLGVFDVLADGPKTKAEIIRTCSISERGAKALLNALVGLNWLMRQQDTYSLTEEAGTFLVRGRPAYFGGMLRHAVENMIPKWANLRETIRTGKPARSFNKEEVGAEYFADFVEDLLGPNFPAAQALAKQLSLLHTREPLNVLDLAAGSGVWGIAAASQSPVARVTAVDWSDVIRVTRKAVSRFQIEERFRFIEGDLLDVDFGSNYSAAILGHVLHTGGPEWIGRALRKTFAALAPGGTIAIAEWLVNDDRSGPVPSLIFAVNMLVHLDAGDSYSYAELCEWLRECGFQNIRKFEAPAPSPLILAEKPVRSGAHMNRHASIFPRLFVLFAVLASAAPPLALAGNRACELITAQEPPLRRWAVRFRPEPQWRVPRAISRAATRRGL